MKKTTEEGNEGINACDHFLRTDPHNTIPIGTICEQTPTFTLFFLSSSTHKKAIPLSLALRLRRICSTNETFKIRTSELTTYLLKRGYKRNIVAKQIQRAADIPRIHTLQPKQTNKPERIPFITTYNPSLMGFNSTKSKIS